jgi:pimeloyl-ACP methyl ester carboxylesterase
VSGRDTGILAKSLRRVAAALLAASAAAMGSAASAAGLAASPAPNPKEEVLHLTRPDGSLLIAYLDRKGGRGDQGLLVMAQGSGCGSVLQNPNIARAKPLLLPEFAVLTVEDYGVGPGDPDRMAETRCPAAYYAHHTISQRVADLRQTLAAVERRGWWTGRLVLFGGSEGGAAIQELAPLVPSDGVVVYSSATGVRFGDAFLMTLPPALREEASAAMQSVRNDPKSASVVFGNSHLWWSDILDRRLSDDLLRAKAPVLVVQGGQDRSNPPASARAVRDAFQAAHDCQLTYLELPDLDHHMTDPGGQDHFEAVMKQISSWVRARLAKTPLPPC